MPPKISENMNEEFKLEDYRQRGLQANLARRGSFSSYYEKIGVRDNPDELSPFSHDFGFIDAIYFDQHFDNIPIQKISGFDVLTGQADSASSTRITARINGVDVTLLAI